jgi:Ku protein
MAALRSSWKGYLKVSLVSCPVRLYPASSGADRISFHNLAPETMSRITMVPTDPTTGKAVPRDQLQKGYEFEKGRYVIVSDEELDKLQIESNRVIDVSEFVDDTEVDPLYLDSPYWLAPDGKMAQETFRVLVEAMRKEGKAAVGRLVLSSRERPVLLSPRGKGIMIRTLRAPEEVRREEPDHQAEVRRVRSEGLHRPLPGGAGRARQGQDQGRDDRHRRARRAGAGGRPDGRLEEVARDHEAAGVEQADARARGRGRDRQPEQARETGQEGVQPPRRLTWPTSASRARASSSRAGSSGCPRAASSAS